jgi:hypothetical protein
VAAPVLGGLSLTVGVRVRPYLVERGICPSITRGSAAAPVFAGIGGKAGKFLIAGKQWVPARCDSRLSHGPAQWHSSGNRPFPAFVPCRQI